MSVAHVAIVLAAGGSTRLGRPKQLLTRDREALVHRVARLLIDTAPIHTVVVIGAQHEAIIGALCDLDVVIARNAAWTDGLSSSLRTAAAAIDDHDGPVLLAICDQPALEAHHLRTLLQGAASAPSRIGATRHGDARGTPVVVPGTLLHDWSLRAADACAADADADGVASRVVSHIAVGSTTHAHAARHGASPTVMDRGLGARLRDVPTEHLFVLDAPELCFDIDTPDDLQRAIAMRLIDRDAAR